MHGLTIHFRLRFAVAVTLAALLLVTLGTRRFIRADHGRHLRVHRADAGRFHARTQGRQIVAELGGQVTTPELPVINGFGATLNEEAADELAARPGVATP